MSWFHNLNRLGWCSSPPSWGCLRTCSISYIINTHSAKLARGSAWDRIQLKEWIHVGREKIIMYDKVFKLNRKHSAEIRAKRSEAEFIYQTSSRAGRPPGRPACTKQGRSTGRSIDVHKRAQGSLFNRPVDRGRRTVDCSVERLTWRTLGWTRSTVQKTDRRIWAQICLSFQDSDFVSELETNPIGVS